MRISSAHFPVFAYSAWTAAYKLSRMQTKPVVSRAKAYLKVRHKSVRDGLKQLKLDGLLLTHAPDLAYLTNFTGENSVGLITEKDFFLITDFRYREQVEIEAGWVKTTISEGKMAQSLAALLVEAKVSRVGFEANFTTYGQVLSLIHISEPTRQAEISYAVFCLK